MNQNQPPVKDPRQSTHTVRRSAVAAEAAGLTDSTQTSSLVLLGFLVVLLVAAYWDMFALTSAAWADGLYSHGWIVPVIALGLLWLRFEPFGTVPAGERWVGLGILAAGLAFRLYGEEYVYNTFVRASFVVSMFGIFLLAGGMQTIRWAWPAIAFLAFMFPLPYQLEQSVLGFLQKVASISSTFVLQTLGVSAFRQGNLISIPGMDQPLTIADACSGLRMATIFVAFAVAMVFLIERPWWDKFIILLSAIPIALIVNIVRITITGLLYMLVGPKNIAVQKICHDWAGLVIMMPLAMALLWLELQILERLTVPVDTVQLRPVGGLRGVSAVPVR